MFVSSNPVCDKQIGRPHDLVITRMIADRIGLHSVLEPLLIKYIFPHKLRKILHFLHLLFARSNFDLTNIFKKFTIISEMRS